MKKKTWKSRLFALSLICSVIMSSAGVVFAGETDDIGLDPIAEESFGETSKEEFSELPAAPELAVVTDENTDIPTGDEEEILVNDEPVNDESVNTEPLEIVIEEPEVLTETEEIPTIDETVIEGEEDLIIVEPETDADMLFNSARAELDSVLTAETDVFDRIRTVYTWVSLAFPETVLTNEELAVLTQRLLENYGVKGCVISGWNETGEQVFWNLAQLDGVFFNLDASLDRGVADQQQWTGFLKGGEVPFGYVRDEAFSAAEFTAAYPVSEEDYTVMKEEADQPEDSETSSEEDDEESDAISEEDELEKEAVEAVAEEVLNTAAAGQSLWFGRYPQNTVPENTEEMYAVAKAYHDNGFNFNVDVTVDGIRYRSFYRFDPIEWIVLGESGGYYKLLSKKVLNNRSFNCSYGYDNWRDSDLRNELNSSSNSNSGWPFFGDAFNKNEQADMQAHEVNTYCDGVKQSTSDKVTLLDKSELSQIPDSSKIAYATEYMSDIGKYTWWLRGDSIYDGERLQASVDTNGDVTYTVPPVMLGVRPVIWVKTSSSYLYTSYSTALNAAKPGYYPDKITLNTTQKTMYVGEISTLKATLSPATAKDKTVKWSSSNTAVATVSASGIVTAKKAGNVTITARTADGKTAACKITVSQYRPITKLTLNLTSLTLNEGASQTLKATPTPSTGVDTAWTWSSSDSRVATVNSMGTVKAVAKGTAIITVKAKNGKYATCKVTVKGLSVQYRTHVQTYGWQNYVSDGAMSGTQGQAKRLEGINIRLVNQGYSGDIQYRTHVQTYGWQTWKKNGQMAGTSGEAKRLEAIQIKLTGELAENYDIYYRTHIQTFGWSGWAKNGAMCGSAGYAKRLEGINIVLVKKGGKAPGSTADSFFENKGTIKINLKTPTLIYTYAEKGKVYNLVSAAGITTDPSTLWTTLSYSSSNTKVAQIVNGKDIKITGTGDADIKVKAGALPRLAGYGPGTATIHVKVLSEQKITISGLGTYDSANGRYNVAYTNQLKNIKANALGGASLTYAVTDKTGKTISSNIAAIDKTGNLKFTGKAVGSFYVTVRAEKKVLTKGGYAAAARTFMVNVTKTTPVISCSSSITKNMEDGSFSLGAKITLGGVMKYTSGDTSVLTVDSKGVVTPVNWTGLPKQKSAKITITSTATSVLNAAKTVTVNVILKNAQVSNDSTKPVISNVKVSDVSSAGYTVTCTVSDNVGIQKVVFPTWTLNDGQDDLSSNWKNTALGTISNGTVTYRVKTSDHSKQAGCQYRTRIYAYDLAGNSVSVSAPDVNVPSPISNIQISDIDRSGYTVSCTIDTAWGISYVDFPTWTETDGEDDIIWHRGTISGNTASCTIRTSDHNNETDTNYLTQIYVKDSSGNSAMADAGRIYVAGEQILLDKTNVTLSVNDTLSLKATASPADLEVVWQSSAPGVVTVDSTGKITAKQVGTAVISVESVSGNAFASCTVEVVGISLNIPSITLNVNETVTLAASVYPPDLTDQDVSWLSTSPETAIVSSTGKITAKSSGVTVVRAEIVSVSGETYVAFCMVTVVDSAAG